MVLLLLTFFALYSTLNIAEFEQINVGWVWENIFPDNKFWHAGLLHKLKSYGISGQLFGPISSFLSKWRLRVVLDGKSSQESPVNAGVPQAPFLVLRFSYYRLMTFITMLSVILLYMLMILLSILSVIGHLICGNNLNWLLNLNLIYETLWTGVRSGLLISMLGKLNWFHLTSLMTLVLLMWKRWVCLWEIIIF